MKLTTLTERGLKGFVGSMMERVGNKEDSMEEIGIDEIPAGGSCEGGYTDGWLSQYRYYISDTDELGYTIDKEAVFLYRYIGDENHLYVESKCTINGRKYDVYMTPSVNGSMTHTDPIYGSTGHEYGDHADSVVIESGVRLLNSAISSGIFAIAKLNVIVIEDCELLSTGYRLFDGASMVQRIVFGSGFDMKSIDDMTEMFSGCSGLTTLDLTMFDTHNVKKTIRMFYGCTNLTEILVSRDKWVISDDCDTFHMFDGCGTDHVTYVD